MWIDKTRRISGDASKILSLEEVNHLCYEFEQALIKFEQLHELNGVKYITKLNDDGEVNLSILKKKEDTKNERKI